MDKAYVTAVGEDHIDLEIEEEPKSKYRTIIDIAVARGLKENAEGCYSLADIEALGLPGMGGCQGCGACIAAYNAYPSLSGYLQCSGCIGDSGFETTDAFEAFCKERDERARQADVMDYDESE